jgi:YidC/Oxa1 family membrane protein insertase
MENNRNFFITIALSVLILTLWQVFYMNPKIEGEREAARVQQERLAAEQQTPQAPQTPAQVGDAPSAPAGAVPGAPAGMASAESRDAAVAASPRRA